MQKFAAIPLVLVGLLLLAGCTDDDDDGGITGIVPLDHSAAMDSSFAVGDHLALSIQDFVGEIFVAPGPAGTIAVAATKLAAREADLDRITITMVQSAGRLEIVCDNPDQLRNVQVDLAITAPADVLPLIQCGVGSIVYTGRPTGATTFQSGVGNIELRLPADVDITVSLAVGVGSLHLGLPVVGTITGRTADGVIGDGTGGTIAAQVGVGDIRVISVP